MLAHPFLLSRFAQLVCSWTPLLDRSPGLAPTNEPDRGTGLLERVTGLAGHFVFALLACLVGWESLSCWLRCYTNIWSIHLAHTAILPLKDSVGLEINFSLGVGILPGDLAILGEPGAQVATTDQWSRLKPTLARGSKLPMRWSKL